ncbi:MAG: hypothetical protein QOF85_2373 [Solirubrobacterales bacterium]|nr:hypothetical protein [Solirubrobacterales bacterium]
MERERLQAIQAPLKERYREASGAAVVTLCAKGGTLLKLIERYCVVFQTLASPPGLSATLTTA